LERRTTGLSTKILAAAIAGSLVFAQVPVAWAQRPAPPVSHADLAAAKKHYGEGERKYKAGDFAGAEADFRAANDIKAAPQTERFIADCEDKQGRYQAAVEWYDRFLAHVPDKMADKGDEARKREAEIKAIPGKLHIESNPPGASVAVDDRAQSAPTPMDVELPPGAHVVKLTAPGRLPTQKTIDVAFASRQSVSADLDPEPPPPPPPPVAEAPPPPPPPSAPPPPPPEPRSKVPAYVTGGLAIVAAGVGTAFGIMALSDKSDFDKNPTSQKADNGDTHALIADMSFGVALTFGVTSAVLFLTRDEPAAAQSTSSDKAHTKTAKARSVTLTPTPMVGPHSGGAGLTLRF
jgi:hypothetical protein